MELRDAREADLPEILALHNHVVATSTAHYNEHASDLADRRALVFGRQSAGLPFLVAAEGGSLAGYASYGPFRPQDGFAASVEHMVYVSPGFQRRGVAALMMNGLFERARAGGVHVMLGAIDAENAASIALHERLGFARVGLMREAARKFGRWLDLLWMQKTFDGA